MSLYPHNPAAGQTIQTAVPGGPVDAAYLAHISLANPAAGSNTAVHAAVTLGNGVTTEVTTAITNPDFPRTLRIKGNAASEAGNVVIDGTDTAGAVISETIALNEANAVDGLKAFKTVTKITLPARTTAGDTVSVGVGEALGLPYKLTHNTVLKAYLNNVVEGTAPTVTTSATVLSLNTVDLNSALNGNPVDVYLMV